MRVKFSENSLMDAMDAGVCGLTENAQGSMFTYVGRCRHHRTPSPQFRHGLRGEENILHLPALVVSAATAHKTPCSSWFRTSN
ncbi:hypothetical protein TNCV_2725951 [Trichonephila clavipes]|nr:hypothetical protein TNCV_2725951 [Trichonephila clavipes]